MEKMFVKKLASSAIIPKKNSKGAAGYDLYAHKNIILKAKSREVIPTGIAIQIPPGNYARIAPRSGLAIKHFIDVGAGVIDQDYQGEIGVVLFNHSDKDFEISVGDRIAQMIIQKVTKTEIEQVEKFEVATERGQKGFGSTGIK